MKIKLIEGENSILFLFFPIGPTYNFSFKLHYHVNTKNNILYQSRDVENVLNNYFGSKHGMNVETFLPMGMSWSMEDKLFLTEIAIKHLFSALVGFFSMDEKNHDKIKAPSFSRLSNSFLKVALNSLVLNRIPSKMENNCFGICSSFQLEVADPEDQMSAIQAHVVKYGSTAVDRRRVTGNERQLTDPKYFDPHYIQNLCKLFSIAGHELKMLLNIDHTYASNSMADNLGMSLVNYEPSTDLEEFTSPPVKAFFKSLCSDSFLDLGKVSLRNVMLLAGHESKYPNKPLGTYWLGILIKSFEDVKLLDLLGRMGITACYKKLGNTEMKASKDFNKVFHDIPKDANVNAAADNGQQNIGSKHYDSHKTHHVDSMNILQAVYPCGDSTLSKTTDKSINDLNHDFILPTKKEIETKRLFNIVFIQQSIEISSLVSSSMIKTPSLSDIAPIPVKPKESIISEFCLKMYQSKGNFLKAELLKVPSHDVAYSSHPSDPSIRWDNKCGNKTCLRHLIIGKSTSPAIFLETLKFLHDTYHNPLRPKIFLTLDQALYDVYQKLKSLGQICEDYVDFFIPVLDAFHLQWTMMKCLYSAYQDAGLRDIFAILGLDDEKWIGIKECRDVHKSEMLLVEVLIALQNFFITLHKGHLRTNPSEGAIFDDLSSVDQTIFLESKMDLFLDSLKLKDLSLGIWIDFYQAGRLCLMAWESQRIENHEMFFCALKEFLKYFFAFNNYNYQHSSIEFLRDIELLGIFYKDLLSSGILFSKQSTDPGKSTSVGYQLELFNKYIKQLTNNLDSTGSAWEKSLIKLSLVRAVLSSAGNLGLFYDKEASVLTKRPDIQHIMLFTWLFEIRNFFSVDLVTFEIQDRAASHLRTGKKLNSEFVQSSSIGLRRLNTFVDLVLETGEMGHLNTIRKDCNFSKIVPSIKVITKKTAEAKKYTKTEKDLLIRNLPESKLPITSLAMLSPNLGASPRLHGNKTDVQKFMLGKYPSCLIPMEKSIYDIVVIDFMPLSLLNIPWNVYSSENPLQTYCHHIVDTYILPNFDFVEKLLICVDRKLAQKECPIKFASQNKKVGKVGKCTGVEFARRLGFILGQKDQQFVSHSFIPPFSWITKDQDVRFQLIYAALDEIIQNPKEYFSNIDNFTLIVNGNLDSYHCSVVTCSDGILQFSTSSQIFKHPEANQSIFQILRYLDFKSALVKCVDSDVLLTSMLSYEQVCGSDKSIHLQYINEPLEVIDLVLLRLEISEDPSLAHFDKPVESLIFALISVGNNGSTGKVYGLSNFDSLYEALGFLKNDLVCTIGLHERDNGNLFLNHYEFLESCGLKYSISWVGFMELFKILYILKNKALFSDSVSLPIPQSIQKWRKPLLQNMLAKYKIIVNPDSGKKTISVSMMKQAIQKYFRENPNHRKLELLNGKTDGIPISDISFTQVAIKIWLAKDKPTEWCPSMHQMQQLYSRGVLASSILGLCNSLPNMDSLKEFGYTVNPNSQSISLNLDTGISGDTDKIAKKALNAFISTDKQSGSESNKKRRI